MYKYLLFFFFSFFFKMNLFRLKSFFLLLDTLFYFNLLLSKKIQQKELFISITDSFLLALILEFFYILTIYFIRNCFKFLYIYILLLLFLFFIFYIINILFQPIKILYQ